MFGSDEEPFYDVLDKEKYRNMMKRDERRFKQADKDGDLIATRDEFTAFLHPEEFDYMKDIVITVSTLQIGLVPVSKRKRAFKAVVYLNFYLQVSL